MQYSEVTMDNCDVIVPSPRLCGWWRIGERARRPLAWAVPVAPCGGGPRVPARPPHVSLPAVGRSSLARPPAPPRRLPPGTQRVAALGQPLADKFQSHCAFRSSVTRPWCVDAAHDVWSRSKASERIRILRCATFNQKKRKKMLFPFLQKG